MLIRRLLGVVVLGALISGGAILARAQSQVVVQADRPTILSGDDIGFRVEAYHDGVAVGRLLVRVDGKWLETKSSMQLVLVK